MPTLDQHQSAEAVKVLVIADSGAGKSGLIGSLANADYRCFIADMDNGLDVLRDPRVVLPEKRKNVYFKTFTDKVGAKGIPVGGATAAVNMLAALDKWEEKDPATGAVTNLGSVYTWGPKDVFILDTLTFFGTAALRWVLQVNNHSGKPPQLQHWGEAMRIQEELLASLYSSAVRCNVVVNSHVTFVGGDEGSMTPPQAYPSALGSKLPPKVATYFNSTLYLRKRVRGPNNIERVLLTQATPTMALKSPKPSIVPAEMPADLAKYFEYIKS